MATSGTYSFGLDGGDLTLEILERVQIRGSAITQQHLSSLRRSINLIQGRFANRGVNLWKVDQQSIPLVQGVGTYNVPRETVMMLDVFMRIFAFDELINVAPNFVAVQASTTVKVYWPAHGLSAGNWMQIVVPVAIGGIVVSGYFQVLSVVDSDNFNITAPFAAQVNESGGNVPLYTTTLDSTTILVTLTSHGLLAGNKFIAQVQTAVGGISIFGAYTVATVLDANRFTIENGVPASATANGYENSGYVQLAAATEASHPVDRWISPISRDDYAAFPDKILQAPPTVFWFDRQSATPQVTVWPVPDAAGPYELRYFRVTQLQDAVLTLGTNPDMPYRGLEALCAASAAHMAIKWAPAAVPMLKAEANETWGEFAAEDRERVPMYLGLDMDTYFR